MVSYPEQKQTPRDRQIEVVASKTAHKEMPTYRFPKEEFITQEEYLKRTIDLEGPVDKVIEEITN